MGARICTWQNRRTAAAAQAARGQGLPQEEREVIPPVQRSGHAIATRDPPPEILTDLFLSKDFSFPVPYAGRCSGLLTCSEGLNSDWFRRHTDSRCLNHHSSGTRVAIDKEAGK